MSLTELTKVTGPGIHTLSNVLSHNIKSSGIITATKFSGPLDSIGGNFAGVITATNGVFSGNISAVDGNFSGNVTIGGTLTYEDVTNIDSVGIITAQKDIHVGAGVSAVGVGTFGSLDIGGDIDVDGHTNLDNVSIAGVTTTSDNIIIPDNKKLILGTQSGRQLHLYHNMVGSSNHVIESTSSSNHFILKASVINPRADYFSFRNLAHNQNVFIIDADNSTKLYFNGNEKLTTENTGVNITGIVTATSADINGDLDVDGHTNLDNVSVAGVSTFAGNSNFNEDVFFLGASSKTITFDKSEGHIRYLDNAKSQFGTQGDLSIYHDGSHSYIDEGGTGNLYIQSNHVNIDSKNGEQFINCTQDGPVELYHNNTVRLITDTTGITVNSRITASGDTNTYINVGSSADTLDFYTGGTNYFRFDSSGRMLLNTMTAGYSTADDLTIATSGSTGITLRSGTTNQGNIYFADGTSGASQYAGLISYNHNTNHMFFGTNDGTERFRINSTGQIITNGGSANPYPTRAATFQPPSGQTNCYVSIVSGSTSGTSGLTFGDGADNNAANYAGMFEYRHNGDTLAYMQNGSDRLRIASDGDLTIVGNDNAELKLLCGSSSGNDIIAFQNSSGATRGNITYDSDNNFLLFNVNQGERLRITSIGRVGIGTNNPQQLLDLYDIQSGASGTAPILNVRNGYAGTPNASNALKSEIRFSHRNHNSAHDFMATRIIADTSDNYNQRTHLRFLVAKGNNGTERLTISPDGYIGINDSTPQYPLDITPDGGNANQSPIIRLFNSTDGCHNAITLESSTSADKNIGIQFKNRNAVRGGIGYIQSDKMSFYSGTTPGNMGITINSSGFVGINKSDPDRTFHVYRNSETWPAGFESNNTTCKISFKSAGTLNMYDVGVGAESRSLIFLTANSIRNDITTDGVMRTRTLGGGFYPVASVRDGSTSARAAQSAWEIKKTLGPAARTGNYYLKNPYDDTVSQWWCDMETDGGGWILVAHTGDGQMASLSTADGNHWWNRSNKGGFDTVGSGYYKGGGYWRKTNGDWGDNTCGQLMWDVRTQDSQYDNYSNAKVVFNWGTDQALPTGGSGYTNIPNAGNRRFNEWCYEVVGAPGFNPSNYHQNERSNIISGGNYFTEHMVMTWCFRGTSGAADDGDSGPYWMIGSHHDGLHQHYEESLSGNPQGVYGSGGYYVVSNEDTGWGGGGSNGGYPRIGRHTDNGTCNVWLR